MKAFFLISLLFLAVLLTGCLGSSSSKTAPTLAFVYVVGQGDNAIRGLSEKSTGDLAPLTVSAFDTNPIPVSIAVHPSKNFLYVPNFTSNTVAGFNIDHVSGLLTPVGTALPPVPITGQTGPVALGVNSAGTFLYVLNQGSGSISTFSIDPQKGLLREIAGTTATVANPQSLVVSPTAGLLYVGNGAAGTISGFAIAANGALTPVAGSPFTAGTSIAGLTIDPKGQFLYAADATNNKIASFGIQSGSGTLTPVAGSPFATGINPVAIAVDANASFLYSANQGGNSVSAFKINGGALTELTVSPFPTATGASNPAFLTVDVSNTFLYVADTGTSNIAAFGIKSDGTLGLLTTSPFPQAIKPSWIVTTK